MTTVEDKNAIASLVGFRPQNEKPVIALVSIYSFESLGVRYIASHLRSSGYRCLEIFYENFKRNMFNYPTPDDLHAFTDLLRRNKVDIVGLSLKSPYFKLSTKLTEAIHKDLGIPVIWGSNHPTVQPEACLEHADAICKGDGEAPMKELLDAISSGGDVTRIKGLWVKKPDGKVVRNGMANYIELDFISDPQYDADDKHYLSDGKWHEGDPQLNESTFVTISSRGCPHKCTYCTNKFYLEAETKFLRFRSVDRVIGEIKRAKQLMPNLKHVSFQDELFTTNKKWTDEFVEKYQTEVGLPFYANLNPSHVSRPLMAKLKKAGLTFAGMGIETGSERVANEVYQRNVKKEKLEDAVKIMHEMGIRPVYTLIIDNPLERSEDKRESFEFYLSIPRPYSLYIFSLTHFPETPLTKKLLEMGFIKETDIEGVSDRSLFDWGADLLTYKGSTEDRFWLALYSLVTKDFIPKKAILWLSRSPFLMRHPAPLVAFAFVSNIIKLFSLAVIMYREGSLSHQLLRRFSNWRSLALVR